MLRYRTGVAGSHAGGLAVAKYLTGETLRPEKEALAKYYAGETVPHEGPSGLEDLGRAIADGRVSFSAALDEMVAAHIRLFGAPEDIEGLEGRIGTQLMDAAGRAEMQDAVAAEGGTVARIRADLDPRLAARLGIDTTRPITQGEIANLLTGLRTDGQPIDGKQVQKPIRSVTGVFGLDEKALPSATAVDQVLARRRADGETPESSFRRARRVLVPCFFNQPLVRAT
jgi:hypothetical protein